MRVQLNGIRHFIIDEYQDLTGIRATLVQRLLEILAAGNDDCGFTVLGDPDQAIYDWPI
jgi:DNA helicase-2/ATP-dependent DNA helicase PcrA